MFGRKPEVNGARPPMGEWDSGDPWDKATLDWLQKSKMLDLRITAIERRFKAGPHAPGNDVGEGNPEQIVCGYLPSARQHIHVEIKFDDDRDSFGDGWLSYFIEEPVGRDWTNIPYISFQLKDASRVISTGLIEALKDAIAAGQTEAQARLWINPEGDWIAEGGQAKSLNVTGAIVWAFTRSRAIDPWRLPLGEANFNGYPDIRQLRATTPKKHTRGR